MLISRNTKIDTVMTTVPTLFRILNLKALQCAGAKFASVKLLLFFLKYEQLNILNTFLKIYTYFIIGFLFCQ